MHLIRTVALAACCVSVLAAGACNRSATPVRPSDLPPTSTASLAHQDGAVPTDDDLDNARELAAVRKATAPFHDATLAAAAGYRFGEPCMQSGAGAMGIHASNAALIADGAIDALRPEVLLYLPKADGTLRLIGVEYVQFVTLRNPDTLKSQFWVNTSPWPSTYQVLTPTPQLFGHTFQGPMAGHTRTMPWHWDLHVWIWAHNPDGMFAQWNSSLQCGA